MLAREFCLAIPKKTRGWRTLLQPLGSVREKLLIYGLLESLARGECGNCFRGNLDLLAVRRTAPGPRLSCARQEGAEADHGDALAFRDVGHDRVEQRIHHFACRHLADVPRFCRNLDQIGLGDHVWHAFSPLQRASIVSKPKTKYNALRRFCA